mgnify:CR=1 FL=1
MKGGRKRRMVRGRRENELSRQGCVVVAIVKTMDGVEKIVVLNEFFFFKQKTAYEVLSGLVGSEMCINDSGLMSLGSTLMR